MIEPEASGVGDFRTCASVYIQSSKSSLRYEKAEWKDENRLC